MISALDDLLGRSLAAWVRGVTASPGVVSLACLALAIVALFHALTSLGINTNEQDLFSDELPHYALREEWNRAFPTLTDPLIVVIDANTVDLAHDAAEALASRLESEPEHFLRVHRPGGGAFFETHAFLYRDIEELDALADNLFAVQPYLAGLSRDASLRGFFEMVGDAVDASVSGDLEGVNLEDVLARVADVVGAHLQGRDYQLSWADVITGRASEPRDRRRVLIVQPVVDFEQLSPAETSLLALRDVVDEMGFDGRSGVQVRTTGSFALSYEEMEHLTAQTSYAGAASFVLVGIILVVGLGSLRLVLASLTTLLVGIAWTAAFASLCVGHLNLISIAFAVLFIGLSIDFAIHLCVRFRDLVHGGLDVRGALCAAAESVGGSLALCALTTAIGFFAFTLTDYVGIAELGIIAGTGMFVSLFTNLTLLPALIAWGVPRQSLPPLPAARPGFERLLALPVRHAPTVIASTLMLSGVAVLAIPHIRFDPNPLRVRDPSTPSVTVFNEMLADGDALIWNLNVLAPNLTEANQLAAAIERLPDVDLALTLSDYVPEDQAEKIALLDDVAFILLPTVAADVVRTHPTREQQVDAVANLERSLLALEESGVDAAVARSAIRVRESLEMLRAQWIESESAADSIETIERAVIGSLPERLRILRSALTPDRVTLASLPADLVETMQAQDGRARIEIFPQKNLNDQSALEAYVRSVQRLAPRAFGEGLVILESKEVVVRALRRALLTAALSISLLLVILWRNLGDALLVAAPLGLATLFTAATSVPLSVPFNFANVIVIPLLLGMGVDTGIHLVHRHRSESLPGGNLLRTSTARAVMLSALTTMATFGTLGLSSHLGIASLGRLLALGIALILLCNLVVLPALIRVASPRKPRHSASRRHVGRRASPLPKGGRGG